MVGSARTKQNENKKRGVKCRHGLLTVVIVASVFVKTR